LGADAEEDNLGAPSMQAAMKNAAPFTLEGHLEKMKCPYLDQRKLSVIFFI